MAVFGAITDILAIKVGHDTGNKAATGCTVVLCEQGAVADVPAARGVSKC